MTRTARIVVASTRAADGRYADTTGPLIADWLAERSFDVAPPAVVPDGEPVARAVRDALAAGADVVLTTGGTGISPTDRTPEATAPVLDVELPGLADAIREAGRDAVPTAVLSRGLAGVAGRALVVNLPGSRGGVADGLAVLGEVLEHTLDQLAGGDHIRHTGANAAPGAADPAAAPDAASADAAPREAAPPEATARQRQPRGSDAADTTAMGGGPGPDFGTARARVALARVTEEDLSVDEHARLVRDQGAGAVVTFGGVVRDHDGGRSVTALYYEGHPTAPEVLAQVVSEVAGRHERVRAVAVSHRLGALEIGDVALACAVAADHRTEAFATCADLVDEVKARLPVWKHQHFSDGTDEWVNSP